MLFLQKRDADQPAGGPLWDSLAEAVPTEDGEEALSINRYFLDHPEMVLGRHARVPALSVPPIAAGRLPGRASRRSCAPPSRACRATFTSPPPKARRPRSIAPQIRVGAAADGATIKEGSYLVVDNQLVQIIDGAPRPVAVRHGKGTEGIPAKHARLIRGLIAVRDAIRAVLRAQETNEPWGPAQIRLRVAYASFVRDFGPINLTTVIETTNPETGERARNHAQPESAALPRRPGLLAHRIDRGLRHRDRQGETGPDLHRARAPSARRRH